MSNQKQEFSTWIATCGPIGYIPIAPGSSGALLGLVFFMGVSEIPLAENYLSAKQAITVITVGIVGLWSSQRAIKCFNRKDPSPVVIDEVFGQLVTFLGTSNAGWQDLVIGFILFRVMDIFKPFPVRIVEKLPGAWGIMLDDGVAGLFSLGLLLMIRNLAA